ncbi:MAG: hypothetical protein II897_04000 [Clostridia bacterium]|nr:hypothetical protein [Clostridia bacterium]
MIQTQTLADGRVRTYSDSGFRIRQLDTGMIYDDAVDSVPHEYEETDELIPVPDYDDDATEEEKALTRYANELTGENDRDLVSATESLITKFTEE